MNEAKIRLSAKEAELLLNADWILTKNGIIRKTSLLLGAIAEGQRKMIEASTLPQEAKMIAPKIAKGENYQGLPWMMLDHPRLFGKENILAIRIMFWWGNFFSITLHLSGLYKMKFEKTIAASHARLKQQQVYYCMNDDPWEHHFEKNNYLPAEELSEADLEKLISGKDFIKLAKKYPLTEWDSISVQLIADFRSFIKLLEMT